MTGSGPDAFWNSCFQQPDYPHVRLNFRLLAPGMVMELWGQNFSSGVGCGPAKETYPRELCGVHVLGGPRPAELLYVSSYQINLKISADVPRGGLVPFQVCSGAQ
jgi:uncharacterized protein (TIGR03437 family)